MTDDSAVAEGAANTVTSRGLAFVGNVLLAVWSLVILLCQVFINCCFLPMSVLAADVADVGVLWCWLGWGASALSRHSSGGLQGDYSSLHGTLVIALISAVSYSFHVIEMK